MLKRDITQLAVYHIEEETDTLVKENVKSKKFLTKKI